ncbi:hypothetical protein Ciccas_014098, partial [Cichlidogyrus casuarinus]
VDREKQRILASSGLSSSAVLLEKYQMPALRNRARKAVAQDEQERKEREALSVDELSPEEAILLEQENQHMWATLNDEEHAFKTVATSIHEIERLNSLLSGHLHEQFTVAQTIDDNIGHANDSIKLGNDSIRSAMSNRSVTRFWIIFTILVLTVSLIFLDWYND